MSRRDVEFSWVMEQMGVRPLDRGRERHEGSKVGSHEREHYSEDEERALFQRAVEDPALIIQDKDDYELPGAEERFRKLKRIKEKKLQLQDSLDLHGKTVAVALDELAHFITRAFARGLQTVVVITGKGRHSPDQRGILKPRVEDWIKSSGRRFIRSYAEAPRAFGGRGAFIIYLRDQ